MDNDDNECRFFEPEKYVGEKIHNRSGLSETQATLLLNHVIPKVAENRVTRSELMGWVDEAMNKAHGVPDSLATSAIRCIKVDTLFDKVWNVGYYWEPVHRAENYTVSELIQLLNE